jgi:hypothetical protein
MIAMMISSRVVGMPFDSLEAVKNSTRHAHEGSFAVHIGAQTKVLDMVENKRFMCTRHGFSKKKRNKVLLLPPENQRSQKSVRRQDVDIMHKFI